MLHTLTSPVGIDAVIDKLNTLAWGTLSSLWNLSQNDWECYGRARIAKGEGGRIVQAPFISPQGNDYRDVLVDDRVAVTSFWIAGAEGTGSGQRETIPLSLVLFGNLNVMYPAQLIGADEYLKLDLIRFFAHEAGHDFSVTGSSRGVMAALPELEGATRDGLLGRADAHPWCTLRLSGVLSLSYYPN